MIIYEIILILARIAIYILSLWKTYKLGMLYALFLEIYRKYDLSKDGRDSYRYISDFMQCKNPSLITISVNANLDLARSNFDMRSRVNTTFNSKWHECIVCMTSMICW